MMSITNTVTLFLLICVSLCTAEVKTTFDQHRFFDNYDLTHNLLSGVECENTTKTSKSSKCQVTQETLDGKYKTLKCEIEFNDHIDKDNILIFNLGKDKVVIRWWSDKENVSSHQFIRQSIVHLSDCKVFEANIDLKVLLDSEGSWNHLGGAYLDHGNDTFDAFYYTETSEDVQKVTFDAQGNIVAEAVDSFEINENFEVLFVSPTSKKDLHVAKLRFANETYEYTLFTDNGSWEIIKTIYENYLLFQKSSDHDRFRLCWLKEGSLKISCKVINLNDRSKSTIKFTINDTDTLLIQNLAHNEFLLLTGKQHNYHVTKYDADGKELGRVDVPMPKCKDVFEDSTYLYTKGDEGCVTQVCENNNEHDIINKCFSNQDFK